MKKTQQFKTTFAVMLGIFAISIGMVSIPALAESEQETPGVLVERSSQQHVAMLEGNDLEWTEIEGKKVLSIPGSIKMLDGSHGYSTQPPSDYTTDTSGILLNTNCDFEFEEINKMEFDEENRAFVPGILIEDMNTECLVSAGN